MTELPLLSVIIPTKNRKKRLALTLEALAQQEESDLFEVVVADNGSSDGTANVLRRAADSLPVTIVPVSQPTGGPAAARNAAIEVSRASTILLLGDDVVPEARDLLLCHLTLHQREKDPNYAVLGRITWDRTREITEFMRWLDSGGPQFHYYELSAGLVSASDYFYSSHVSLSRTLLEKCGGFDETFRYAALEDTELGTRLDDEGLELDYHPELVVLHDHPTTLETSLNRMERVGRSAALFNRGEIQRHHRRVGTSSTVKWALASLAATPIEHLARFPMPRSAKHFLWRSAHLCRFHVGYAKEQVRQR